MTDEEMRPTLSILLGNINDSLNTVDISVSHSSMMLIWRQELDRIDDNLVWELGRSLDRNTPNAWLNEDPSLRQTLDFIESQPEMAAQAAAELTIQTKYQIEKANDISSAPGHKNSHGYPNDLKKNPDLALVPGQTTESITMVQGSDHQGRPVIAKIQIHLSVQDIEVKLIWLPSLPLDITSVKLLDKNQNCRGKIWWVDMANDCNWFMNEHDLIRWNVLF